MTVDWHALTTQFDSALTSLGNAGLTRERLIAYLTRLWEANKELNLVSRRMKPERLMTDHVLDCLAALPFLPIVDEAADLGSGGGLPGILLAIHRPETTWWLYEKSPLKRRFLSSLSTVCPNIRIEDKLERDGLRDSVELVTARGFKPLAVILNLTEGFRARGGRYALYKARKTTIEAERRDAGLASHAIKVQPLTTFGDIEERHLVLMPKPSKSEE